VCTDKFCTNSDSDKGVSLIVTNGKIMRINGLMKKVW